MKTDLCEWIGRKDERCTNTCIEGKSYCESHVWSMYQKGTALGKRKKDKRIADDVRLWESLLNEVSIELEDEGF